MENVWSRPSTSSSIQRPYLSIWENCALNGTTQQPSRGMSLRKTRGRFHVTDASHRFRTFPFWGAKVVFPSIIAAILRVLPLVFSSSETKFPGLPLKCCVVRLFLNTVAVQTLSGEDATSYLPFPKIFLFTYSDSNYMVSSQNFSKYFFLTWCYIYYDNFFVEIQYFWSFFQEICRLPTLACNSKS